MDQQQFYQLVDGYLLEKMTAAEEKEFFSLLEQPAYQQLLKDHIGMQLTTDDVEEAQDNERKERIKTRLNTLMENEDAPVRHINWYKRIAVAASIVFALGLGTYFLFFNKPAEQPGIVKTTVPDDVEAPSINRAMITLSDGSVIYLDSAGNGSLTTQGNIKLVKLADGKIAYQTAGGEIIKDIQYNTLSNPRGSKVMDMTLSDGSHVWLNAGSSVTFPVAFVGNQRKVEITGEAYFEIAHDKTKPFIVSANTKADITVLGTHFNVNAYDDEAEIKVTLLEGSVKVSNQKGSKRIKPGQQAVVLSGVEGSPLTIHASPDLDEVMAWKNGSFRFGEAGIEEVMRQVSRWYDVEVMYESKPTEHFRGEISRNVEVSKVLKMLELTEAVHFRIEGRKVYVTK